MRKKIIIYLFVLGFVIRIFGGFFYGTGDVEWWKGWTNYAVKNNLTEIYSNNDDSFYLKMIKEKKGFDEIVGTLREIPYKSFNYTRTEFRYIQPPIFIYTLSASGYVYKAINHNILNGRIFNFFVNIFPLIASALITLTIYKFLSKIKSKKVAILGSLIYWLNPLVILNSPLQGYQDPVCALFAVLSVFFCYNKKIYLSLLFLTLAVLTKPQGILVAPIILLVGLLEFSFFKNLKAWLIALLTGLIITAPFILTHHFLSMLYGILSSNNYIVRLSQGLNFWWVVQDILEKKFQIEQIAKLTLNGIDLQLVGLVLMSIFTAINLWYVAYSLKIKNDRNAIVIGAALQVYIFFMLKVGILVNHYFLLIPIFGLIALVSKRNLRNYILISGIFLVQDLIMYGLGRDFIYPTIFVIGRLFWVSDIFAVVNVLVFLFVLNQYYSVLKTPLKKIGKLIILIIQEA